MFTPTVLTVIALIAFVIVERKYFSRRIYQVLAKDNSWVAEVSSKKDAVKWKKKGYQVFQSVTKAGRTKFRKI